MTVLPMKTRLELVVQEQRRLYMSLCAKFQALKREIEQFNAEITEMKRNVGLTHVGLTHNAKLIPFPKANIRPN
jgi:hypothetical protein